MKNSYFKNYAIAVVYACFSLFVVGNAIYGVVTENFVGLIYCLITLILFLVPYLAFIIFKFRFPPVLEISYLIFVVCAETLGSVDGFYELFWWWDILLHTMWGFICAAVGFYIFSVIIDRKKIPDKSPLLHCGFALCFSLSTSMIWEFLEFGADTFFGMDVQKDTLLSQIHSTALSSDGSVAYIKDITDVVINGEKVISGGYLDIGLFDTIEDMFVGFAGAVLFFIISLIVSYRRKDSMKNLSK